MTSILDIRNATIYRGRTLVFDRLSFEISEGCHTAILGPNGAGKTTLLQLITSELHPVAAPDSHVRIFGQQNWNVWNLRTRLGIISPGLQEDIPPHPTALEVVLSGLYSSLTLWPHQHFTDPQRARALGILERLHAAELRDRPYGSLSTGEQRRLLVGRALIHDPSTLVLDEPTSGLDLKSCFQYLSIVRDLIRSGKTLILVTQQIQDIPPEIDRVVLLSKGRLVADGPKQSVLTSAQLSSLYEVPVRLVHENGYYHPVPAGA